jgi:uncharacterized membrane protein HdeD (DUF308 family)
MATTAKPAKDKGSHYRNMSENWKSVVTQGAIALAIGIVIIAVPNMSEKVVRYLLGAFLIVYAIISVFSARSASVESQPTTWLYVRAGLALAGGLAILFWPGLTNLTLLYILAVFAIVAGVVIGASGLLQKWDRGYKAIAAAGGLLSVGFGIVLISYASDMSASIVMIAGVYAILLGLLLLVLGMGARGISKGTSLHPA